MKVLIADDAPMICEWLALGVEQHPACELVGVARNGKEALAIFKEHGADLVLTDIKMPVMGGLDLLRAIRAESQETRVVLLTAFSEFDLAREALRDGANEYLLKTEMESKLLQALLDRMARLCVRRSEEKKQEQDRSKRAAEGAGSLAHGRPDLLERTLEDTVKPTAPPGSGGMGRPYSKAVRLATEYINERFAEPLNLEQIAAEIYLNPEYFSRIFKEEMGCSFVTYLTDLRLKKALQLLEDTALRVQYIAQSVGYPNVSYFSTSFKKKFGLSPYEYRRRSGG